MSLTSNVFTVHSILQKLVPQPWYLISNQQCATTSNSYSKNYFKLLRLLSRLISFGFYTPFVICRMWWLFINRKSYTIQNVDQAVVYGFFCCFTAFFLAIFRLQHSCQKEIIYVVNQLCKFRSVHRLVSNSKNYERLQSNFEHKNLYHVFIVYVISICYVLLILCFSAFPLAVSYCPLQLIFGSRHFIIVVEAFYFSVIMTFNILSFCLLYL